MRWSHVLKPTEEPENIATVDHLQVAAKVGIKNVTSERYVEDRTSSLRALVWEPCQWEDLHLEPFEQFDIQT